MKIKGKIEKKSQYGIMVDGKWYNHTIKTKAFVEKFKVGDEVEITVNDKDKIDFISLETKPFTHAKETRTTEQIMSDCLTWTLNMIKLHRQNFKDMGIEMDWTTINNSMFIEENKRK